MNVQGPQSHRARRPLRLHWKRQEHDRAEGREHGQGEVVRGRDQGGA